MTAIASTDPLSDIIPSEPKSNKLVLGQDNFERLVRGTPDENEYQKIAKPNPGRNAIDNPTPVTGTHYLPQALESISGLRFENPEKVVLTDTSGAQSHRGSVSFAANQYLDSTRNIPALTEKMTATKMAGQQDSKIIVNKNEQKAFSTYVLSYVDNHSSIAEIHVENATALGGKFQAAEEKLNIELASHFSVNHKDMSRVQQVSEQVTAEKIEKNRESHIALSYMRTFYEKLKITVFGSNEKTVVVRDYYSDEEYSVADFQKRVGSDVIPVKKLILNGKEI